MFKNNTVAGSERAKKPRILIATGGSGGHIFPGLAIAEKLRAEGYACTFIGYGRHFAESVRKQGFDFIMLPATQWNVPSLTKRLRALVDLGRAFIRAMVLVQRLRPAVVLGMGGYASVAAVLAGKVSGVPTAIHEQNVKPGRANLLLGRWADAVLLSFDASRAFFRRVTPQKFHVVGNPVRTQVLALAAEPRAENPADMFHLLVFGGSQGARVFSQVVPQMVAELSPELRTRLRITQQARAEDVNAVQEAYAKLHMTADVAPFFDDLPQRLHQAHLLIGRAGVGTVAEAAVLNRASILVPLRLADGHQLENAKVLGRIGAAVVLEEHDFTVPRLATEVRDLMTKPARLRLMEENAALAAKPNAANDAAQEVIRLVQQDVMNVHRDTATAAQTAAPTAAAEEWEEE